MRLPFLLLLLSGSLTVRAQTTTFGPWNIGLKLGTGASYSSSSSNRSHPWNAYTGGLSGGYSFKVAGAFLTLQADALLERRAARPWQLDLATNSVLFVPVYLRTNRPAARMHFLLGGGPTWLLNNSVPLNQMAAYSARQVAAAGLVGLEVRLLPLLRYETTLLLSYRAGFMPEYIHYRQSLALRKYYGGTRNIFLAWPDAECVFPPSSVALNQGGKYLLSVWVSKIYSSSPITGASTSTQVAGALRC